MSGFSLQSKKIGEDSVLLRLQGEFEGLNVVNYEPRILEDLGRSDDKFVLDLSGVPYIDSSAIGLLIRIAKEAKRRGVKPVLLKPTDKVMRILGLVRIEELFQIDMAAE